jgi:hypothetical protein
MAETDRFYLVVCIVPEQETAQLRFTENTYHVIGPVAEKPTQDEFEKQLHIFGFCAFERVWPERTRYQLQLAKLIKEAEKNGLSLEELGLDAAAEIQKHLKARQ